MKIFITLSIFAMISAGAYGFIDMSRDVFQGTMINYRQAEAEMNKSTATSADSLLRAASKGKFVRAAVDQNSTSEKLFTYVIRSYSRGEPEKVKVVLKKTPREDSISVSQVRKAIEDQNSARVLAANSNAK